MKDDSSCRCLGILAACLLLSSCAAAKPAETSTPVTASKPSADLRLDSKTTPVAFTDSTGVTVEIVSLESPADEPAQVLFLLSGVKNVIGGIAIRASVETDYEGDRTWRLTRDGGRYTVMIAYKGGKVTLRLPGTNIELHLKFDQEAGTHIAPEAVLANHLENLGNGSIAHFEDFDRPKAEQRAETQLHANWEQYMESCQVPVSVLQANWSAYSDDSLRRSNHCSDAFRLLAMLCGRNSAARTQVQQLIKRVSCIEGDVKQVSFKDGTLIGQGHSGSQSGLDDKDLAALRKELKLRHTVLKSDSGLLVVVDPDSESLFSGTSNDLFKQKPAQVRGRTHEDRYLWEGAKPTSLKRTAEDTWIANCQPAITFKELAISEGNAVLDGAKFQERIWRRTEFALARDDSGTYYYVDRLVDEHGGAGYRVFRGPRGRATKTGLVDIVKDSRGTIFATTSGKLRLVFEKDGTESTAYWIKGKKKRQLTLLPTKQNLDIIYNELGVYADVSLGTLCSQ